MSTRKTNLSLTGYAISRLGTGYIYGTYGHILTNALLAAKIRQYPTKILKYEEFIRMNWLNKPVQDCVGLIKGHYWTNDDGKLVYKLDGLPDVSANGMLAAAQEKGAIGSMPEIKGLIVWKKGHVGVYIGSGEVVESHGTKSGVIKTILTKTVNETNWTNWFKCPFIDYVQESIGPYVVKKGDTPWSIAKRFLGDGRRYLDLVKLNNLTEPYTIYTGQILKIDGYNLYTVQLGDSPWKIAATLLGDGKRYVELIELNDLAAPYTLKVGQVLTVPVK